LLIGQILRQSSFHAVEALVYDLRHDALSESQLRSVTIPWAISPSGSIPTQRGKPCSPSSRGAKRNKAFDDCRWIGLAIDGTGAGWRAQQGCSFCRPRRMPRNRFLAINILS